MNIIKQPTLLKHVFILVLTLSFSTVIFAQDDNTVQVDTIQQKKERKAKSSFKVSAGVNFNDLSVNAADLVESSTKVGYNLGFSYKRGRFFYYEIGGRFNKRSFDLTRPIEQIEGSISVTALDIPLTAGINITSFVDRLIGVRVFVSAIPSITINKDVDIPLPEWTNDVISDFMFYGQVGAGFDIAFFFVEAGYNFGFSNIDSIFVNSKPTQTYVNVGFRF